MRTRLRVIALFAALAAPAFGVSPAAAPDSAIGDQKISLTYYFARDVGVVKQTASIGGKMFLMELEKVEIPK